MSYLAESSPRTLAASSTTTTSTPSRTSLARIRIDPGWLDRMYYWNTTG